MRDIYEASRYVTYDYHRLAIFPARICPINERPRYPLICDGAFSRSLIVLSCNIIANVFGSGSHEVTKFLGEVDRNHSCYV